MASRTARSGGGAAPQSRAESRSDRPDDRSWNRQSALARRRPSRLIIVAISIALFALGILIDSLPSDQTHDRYWFLFVAPMMIGLIVGVVALPMLAWCLLPRRDGQPLDA